MKPFSHYIFIFLLLTGCLQLQAQGVKLNKANRLLENFRFTGAIELYKEILAEDEDNAVAMLGLAKAYRMLNNPEEAAKWYGWASPSFDTVAVHRLHYAQVLMSIKRYDEAAAMLEQYLVWKPDDRRAANLLSGCENINAFYAGSNFIKIDTLSISTGLSDFGPTPYPGGICFTSSGYTPTGSKKDVWSAGQPMFDLFIAFQTINDSWTIPLKLPDIINTEWHEGPASFDSSGNILYFTRHNYDEAENNGMIRLKIFSSQKDEAGNYQTPKELSFNSNSYSCGHPALNSDGNMLFFSSDMPGGFGGLDIYFSESIQGEWGPPVNLGKDINTEGNESFPYLYNDSLLYFSSNGHPGLGGLDLYVVDYLAPQKPRNLGAPLNSAKDDFSYMRTGNGHSGYFASNRGANPHNDDIYSFTQNKLAITLHVVDAENNLPLKNFKLLFDSVERAFRDTAEFIIEPGYNQYIHVMKYGFFPKDTIIDAGLLKGENNSFIVHLKREPKIILQVLINDAAAQKSIQGAKVAVSQNKNLIIEEKAGVSGILNIPAEKNQTYSITATAPGYFESAPVTINTARGSNDTIPVKMHLSKIKQGAVIRLDNIYYNLDEYIITETAAQELDKLVRLLKQYPKMTIELRSHTDSRAKWDYNTWLSRKRAETAAQYIASKGIAPSRVTARGYGESLLVNNCKDGVACSETEHQQNRRTEFKIVNMPEDVDVVN